MIPLLENVSKIGWYNNSRDGEPSGTGGQQIACLGRIVALSVRFESSLLLKSSVLLTFELLVLVS